MQASDGLIILIGVSTGFEPVLSRLNKRDGLDLAFPMKKGQRPFPTSLYIQGGVPKGTCKVSLFPRNDHLELGRNIQSLAQIIV